MRLTTKIVLSIILAIFILSIGFIIGFSFTDRKDYKNTYSDNQINIPQIKITEVEVQPFKTILIEKEPETKHFNMYIGGTVHLHPVTDASTPNTISLPEEVLQYSDIKSLGDTLRIMIKVKDVYSNYNTDSSERTFYSVSGLNFHIPTSSNIDVVCRMNEIATEIKDIKTNNVKISTNGKVLIDSCNINILSPMMNGGRQGFIVKNSKVNELNIDLDYTKTWNVENSEITTLNLTGSNKNEIQLRKSEIKRANWKPKNKEARLQVTLFGDSATVVF
ncbi:hypothetical protein D0T49_02425 [Paludibacter sp. 221]|uniref:hypothetical protein n=1 Tax=Paludibacter sp. 221 TaxID=2302939 RepID=UPI0013D3A727|nr:hypothetical protein [Paludibacter sp. 221]NDV45902.1 hypothetical protein [Paludibacter sp. 221]